MGLEDTRLKGPADAEPSWRADCHTRPCEICFAPFGFPLSGSPHS